jgi:hypothetical protein
MSLQAHACTGFFSILYVFVYRHTAFWLRHLFDDAVLVHLVVVMS